MGRRDAARSALWVAGAAVPAYLVLYSTNGAVHQAAEKLSNDLLWAVPFILAISVSLFGSMLRVFDHIKETLADLDSSRAAQAEELASETGEIVSALLQNGLLAIAAGVVSLVLTMLKAVPAIFLVAPIEPTWFATAWQLGLSVLIVRILVVQFQTIPEFVTIYRFFTFDHALRASKGNVPSVPATRGDENS